MRRHGRTWIEYALQRKDTQIVALVDTNKASALATTNKFQLSAKSITI